MYLLKPLPNRAWEIRITLTGHSVSASLVDNHRLGGRIPLPVTMYITTTGHKGDEATEYEWQRHSMAIETTSSTGVLHSQRHLVEEP